MRRRLHNVKVIDDVTKNGRIYIFKHLARVRLKHLDFILSPMLLGCVYSTFTFLNIRLLPDPLEMQEGAKWGLRSDQLTPV